MTIPPQLSFLQCEEVLTLSDGLHNSVADFFVDHMILLRNAQDLATVVSRLRGLHSSYGSPLE